MLCIYDKWIIEMLLRVTIAAAAVVAATTVYAKQEKTQDLPEGVDTIVYVCCPHSFWEKERNRAGSHTLYVDECGSKPVPKFNTKGRKITENQINC